MKIVATGFGGPDRLSVVAGDAAKPGPDDVAIMIRAAGVNPVDRKRYADPGYFSSHGQPAPDFPVDLGVEAAGIVVEVGAQALGPAGSIEVGDEVIAFRVAGAYADRIITKAANVVPKPARLSFEQAGSMMLTGTTAAHTLAAVRARPGQTVLVHGAAGGVGIATVQLARLAGIRVIGTASEKDFDRLRRYGADPVTYGEGLEGRVRVLAPDGVIAAIDLIGTDEAIEASLALVADRSRIATIVAFERAARDGILALGGSPGQDEAGIAIRMNARLRLTALMEAEAYDVPMPRAFRLDQAADAHRLVDKGGAGRLVLVPASDR